MEILIFASANICKILLGGFFNNEGKVREIFILCNFGDKIRL